MTRPPLSSLPGSIPLKITDAPLTVEQLRAILGPHIDSVVQRLVESMRADEARTNEEKSA